MATTFFLPVLALPAILGGAAINHCLETAAYLGAAVLAAYVAGQLLALLPFTPGGLGFVEAGLVATLTLAGVPSRDALAATLLYRIVAYWLPLLAGSVAYLVFRHRYGSGDARS